MAPGRIEPRACPIPAKQRTEPVSVVEPGGTADGPSSSEVARTTIWRLTVATAIVLILGGRDKGLLFFPSGRPWQNKV